MGTASSFVVQVEVHENEPPSLGHKGVKTNAWEDDARKTAPSHRVTQKTTMGVECSWSAMARNQTPYFKSTLEPLRRLCSNRSVTMTAWYGVVETESTAAEATVVFSIVQYYYKYCTIPYPG